MPIYWVADTGTEITFSGAKAGAEFSIGDILFYEEGHADDNSGYGSYTAPLKIWLSDTEQEDPVHYTDNFYYAITYQGKTMLICFMKENGTPAEPAASGFTDVPSDMYYAQPVDWAVKNSITSGTSATTFSPEQTCTRGQIITFLYKAVGAPEIYADAKNPFGDVSKTDYFYDPTVWAAADDVAAGETFAPNENCTRGAAMEFIWRSLGCPEPASQDNPFQDVSRSDSYYDAVLWAVGEGITGGTSATTFSPGQTCTRGQIMTFLYKTFG